MILAVLGLAAFAAILAVAFVLFVRWDTRRHSRARAELEAEHQAAVDAADRALRESQWENPTRPDLSSKS